MRSVLALLAGIIIAIIVISIVQYFNAALYPIENFDASDTEAIRAIINDLPISSLLITLLSYILGSFFGGYIIARIAVKKIVLLATVLGAILMTFGFVNLSFIPHPLWFSVISTIIYIPLSYFGAKLGSRNKRQKFI